VLSGGKLRWVALQALSPLDVDQVGVDSVDVRLGQRFWIPKPSEDVLDLSDKSSTLEDVYNEYYGREIVLPPGGFVLGYMFEYVTMPAGVTAMFSLRSFNAQRGAQQAVSVWIRQGWKGDLVLEISNDLPRPVKLRQGMLIGQLHFFETDDGISRLASGTNPAQSDFFRQC
jgi:deoxycytidine triphosphate deaminase